jgi:hypothetical protein
MAEDKGKIVFVLGMHRSGTSLTAELVSGLGYAVPGHDLAVIKDVNARGFWESQEVVDFNERLLAAAHLKWFHVCPVGHFFKAISSEDLRDISVEIKAFIDTEIKKHKHLVIKDPRLCLLLPVWLSVIDRNLCDVKIIFVNRHPASVAGSLQARDGFSLFSGHLLWLYYFFSVFCRDGGDEIFCLGYENMLSDPHSCGKILQFLGVDEIDGEQWLKIIDGSLQRNFGISFPDDGHIYNLAKYTHTLFLHGSVVKNSMDFSLSRNDFEKFVFENNDFVYALNESNNRLSKSMADCVSIGEMHTRALEVIQDKDVLIHGLEAVIAEKDSAVHGLSSALDEASQRLAELSAIEHESRELKAQLNAVQSENGLLLSGIERNTMYIAECEGRIFDLEFALAEFIELRKRLSSLERLVRQRNSEAKHNEAYIGRLSDRIAELHEAMSEFESLRLRIAEIEEILRQRNRDIDAARHRIASADEKTIELDELFVGQRSNYLSALNVINELEQKLSARNEEFFFIVDELSALKDRVERLLSWRIVKIIDNRINKGVRSND